MNNLKKLSRSYKVYVSLILIGIVLPATLLSSCTCNCSPDNDGVGGDWNPDLVGVIPSRIVFASDHSGNYEIYMMDDDGSNLTNLTNNPANDSSPTWSPDGKKIAFSSDRDDREEGFGKQYELYVMNADGSEQTRITTTGAHNYGTWSPDGSKIVYESGSHITVVNLDGSGSIERSEAEMPKWSPDGSKIAYLDDSNLVVVNSDGLDQRIMLTIGTTNYCDAMVWLPDSSRIAYIFGHSLQMINVDGTGLTELVNSENSLEELSISPDGSRIAYATDTEIWVIDADGTDETRVFGPDAPISNFCWSSDSAKIAFSFFYYTYTSFIEIGPKSGIYTIDVDSYAEDINSEELTKLTDIFSSPIWSP
jgi:Tol biopolymer transport system component